MLLIEYNYIFNKIRFISYVIYVSFEFICNIVPSFTRTYTVIANYNLVFKVHISVYLKPVLYQLGQLRFSFRFIQILQQPF